MDKVACCVLDKICSLSSMGRYVVVSADELYECFPEECDVCETELNKAVKTLVSEGYIDLKYHGGEMYCAAPLKKFVPEAETVAAPEVTEPAAEISSKKTSGKLPVFLCAFAGGAAGSLIVSLIFALV